MSCSCSSPSISSDCAAWYQTAVGNEALGMCPSAALKQCNALFQADAVDLAAGASGTLLFDTTDVFFDYFRPAAIIFSVTSLGNNQAGGASAFSQTVRDYGLESLVVLNKVDYKGTSWLSNDKPVNLDTFKCCDCHLGVAAWGDIQSSQQNPSLDVSSIVDPAVGLGLRVYASIVGWSVRGNGAAPPPWTGAPMPGGAGRIPPGSISGTVKFKANTPGSAPLPVP